MPAARELLRRIGQSGPRAENRPLPMNREPDFLQNLRTEFSSIRMWLDRAIVLGYAVLAGLFVVGFTLAAEWAFGRSSGSTTRSPGRC